MSSPREIAQGERRPHREEQLQLQLQGGNSRRCCVCTGLKSQLGSPEQQQCSSWCCSQLQVLGAECWARELALGVSSSAPVSEQTWLAAGQIKTADGNPEEDCPDVVFHSLYEAFQSSCILNLWQPAENANDTI